MNLRTSLVFVALLPAVWAQAPAAAGLHLPESAAPPEVAQALRDRVNGFYQNHTGAVNRKAAEFVAEDTQDYYFAAKKTVYTKFALQSLDFVSKDFDRAEVTVETTYMMPVEAQLLAVTQPSTTTWKLENGKWYWYHEVQETSMTPMSIFAAVAQAAAIKGPQSGDPAKPPVDIKNLNIEELMANQQRAILQQSKLDRDLVEFTVGVDSEQQVTLLNNFTGDIMLQMQEPNVPGLKVTIEKATLHPKENGVVRFQYRPAEDAKAQEAVMTVTLVPFSQTFPIRVSVKRAQ